MITQTRNLNLITGGIPQIINVSQYDKGETLTFNLYNQSSLFTIPSDSQVLIQGTKPDGHGFQYACAYNGSVVTATLTQQMTAVAGDVIVELSINKDNITLGTANFILKVEECALKDSAVISDSELPLLIELAGEQVKQAEAWANGTRDGQPIGSSDPAYNKNAKYWANEAKGYLGPYGITEAEWARLATLWAI